MSPFLQNVAAKLFQKQANYNLNDVVGYVIVLVIKLFVSMVA